MVLLSPKQVRALVVGKKIPLRISDERDAAASAVAVVTTTFLSKVDLPSLNGKSSPCFL